MKSARTVSRYEYAYGRTGNNDHFIAQLMVMFFLAINDDETTKPRCQQQTQHQWHAQLHLARSLSLPSPSPARLPVNDDNSRYHELECNVWVSARHQFRVNLGERDAGRTVS